MAFLAGFALAICGLAYQTIFQNDLASPYTLGVSSGSAFGAVLAIKFNLFTGALLFSSINLFAFIGGFITLALLLFLSAVSDRFSNFGLLLTGVSLNFFFSALILLLFYISNFNETFRIHRWLMGAIDEIGMFNSYLLAGALIIVFFIIYLFREDLNLMSMTSEETAASRGLNIISLKVIMLIFTTLLISMTVAFCGPIGFVGLICPHIAKLMFGYNHKTSIITAGFFGGAFLTLCFTFSRLIIFPFIIPVGVITSVLGGPFLIYLLYTGKNK